MTINTQFLTKQEALQLIDFVQSEGCFESHGSSRAVFSIKVNDKTYVVKIALDSGGRLQNKVELDTWACHNDDFAEPFFLNPIRYAYKDLILICDWVETTYMDVVDAIFEGREPDEWLEYIREIGEWENDDDAFILDQYNQIENVLYNLNEIQGETGDNCQIGYNNELGCYVAYDYGYDVSFDREDLVGDIEYFLDDMEFFWSTLSERMEEGD